MYRKKLMRACLTGLMVVTVATANVAPVFAAEAQAVGTETAGKEELQKVSINYFDEGANKQVKEVALEAEAEATEIALAVIQKYLPADYNLVSTDYQIRGGYVYVSVKKDVEIREAVLHITFETTEGEVVTTETVTAEGADGEDAVFRLGVDFNLPTGYKLSNDRDQVTEITIPFGSTGGHTMVVEKGDLSSIVKIQFVDAENNDEVVAVHIVYEKDTLSETLGEVLSAGGYRQLRIAETEKYAHVTYFFNGGEEEPFEGEDRILVKSPQVATYDLQPEMSAYEVTDKVVQAIQDETYDMIILNFANPDMVGHTGSFEAAVKAVQAVDTCLGRIVEAIRSKKGHLLVTADHGNAELMVNHETGKVHTAHTTNLVPLILMSDSLKTATLEAGKLCDIAPTLLDLAGIQQPKAMTGHSLVHKA